MQKIDWTLQIGAVRWSSPLSYFASLGIAPPVLWSKRPTDAVGVAMASDHVCDGIVGPQHQVADWRP